MKITNRQMVTFMNVSSGILQLKIPQKLYAAVSMNRAALSDAAQVYGEQQDRLVNQYVKKDAGNRPILNGESYAFIDAAVYYKELAELLELESDVTMQLADNNLFELMDSMEKFDSLSGEQYAAIEFMMCKKTE